MTWTWTLRDWGLTETLKLQTTTPLDCRDVTTPWLASQQPYFHPLYWGCSISMWAVVNIYICKYIRYIKSDGLHCDKLKQKSNFNGKVKVVCAAVLMSVKHWTDTWDKHTTVQHFSPLFSQGEIKKKHPRKKKKKKADSVEANGARWEFGIQPSATKAIIASILN